MPEGVKDLAGSGGVGRGFITHSDCFTSTAWFEPFAESHPARIGHITLDVKHTGKPSAGNLPAGFDEAGTGNRRTIRLVRHSQRKRGAIDRLNLRRLAPVLDPTTCPIPDGPPHRKLMEWSAAFTDRGVGL